MKITKKMLDEFKASIDGWGDFRSDDKELIKCYADDRKQLMRVYKLLKAGKVRQALKVANDLDTIVRDQITDDIYGVMFDAEEEANND
jgi:hypothetical protein